jgi:4-amino-4-deoxy-L-arabinose transferase-like glycosyltransferase
VLLPLILATYGLLHTVIRLVISGSAELDEAEQLLLSQAVAIGYTEQPPLYTWLLIGFEAIFGVGILSLAILKNVLLFLTHFCLFLGARIALNDAYLAGLTSLSLWLVPQIAWESHRDLTHSVLVTSISSGFFYVMMRVLHSGQTRHYVLLGVLLGLGALSKHSFLLFAATLTGAVLCQPDLRHRLLDRRALVTLGLATAVILPHVVWLFEHVRFGTAPTTRKLELQHGMQSVQAIAIGLGKLIWACIRFLSPLWLVCLVIFPSLVTKRAADSAALRPYRQMLERFFLLVLGILAAAVVLFGVTHFKDRWMQPFLFLAPLYVFMRLQAVGGMTPRRLQLFTRLLVGAGLVFLIAPLAQAWAAPWFGMYSRLHVPFEAIARQLKEEGFRQGTVVAETTFMGGNLRLTFPHARVLTPELTVGLQRSPRAAGQCLVIWNGQDRQALPASLRAFLEHTLGARPLDDSAPHYIEARLKHSRQQVFRVGVLLWPTGLGDCR